MPPIRPLDRTTVNLMAAGETIDSLAAAVRETIENALDAAANRIAIAVSLQQWDVSVTDNGCGIAATDLSHAAQPYCTSKAAAASPLSTISTLGFRGEALHRLAQLSYLQIRTRADADDHGWLATYDAEGELSCLQPAAGARGTTAISRDIFAHWPARRQALCNRQLELRRIVDTIHWAALAHAHVTWSLHVDDKPYLSLWAGDSAADTIAQILKRVERSDLRTVEQDGVVATIGLPDRYHRPRPDWIGVAVNGRYVNCPPLLQVIQSAFHRTLPRDRHPLCLIQLRVSPEEVDWNRHPAKQELYLQKVTDYQVAVQTAIEAALADCEPIATKRSRQFLLDNRRCQDSPPDTAISKPTTLLEEPNRYTTAPLTPIKVLAQVQNTYILVEHANGLWLVEQHVAHERIRYEQLLEEWQFVSLPEPLLLKDLSDRQVERLETLQLSPTPFGDNLWAIRHMPQMLQDVPDLAVALRDLSNCTDLDAARVAIACRTAIRNGTPLSPAEMQIVIDRWRVTGNPHTCPHGRPIYLTLTETDLARFFRRHWNLCSRGWGEGPIGDRFSADIRQASSR